MTLGHGDAMTALYVGGVNEFMTKLCSVSETSSFQLLPDCTWMRAVLRGGSTTAHSDVGYFIRRTDCVVNLIKHWKADDRIERERRCDADGCLLEDPKLYACVSCRYWFHRDCQNSLTTWLSDASLSEHVHRWYCDDCLNAPSSLYTCWMPLTDLTEGSSRLQLISGSHTLGGYDRMQRAGNGDELPADYTATYAESAKWLTVPANMKAGDLVLFNWKLIHAASKHQHEQLRMSLDTRIFMV